MAKQVWTATGRRKRSSAQVRLTGGTGNIIVNGVDVNEYFPNAILVMDLKQPLAVTDNMNRFEIDITVNGGGYSGQAGAIRHGIARALNEANSEYRPALKQNGFLTRDPRMKERKKYGLKKARKAPQFSKR